MRGKDETATFIRSTFRSVWSLELLCHLRRHQDREWTPQELVATLRASDLIISQSLGLLTSAGLAIVHSDGSARYQPTSAKLDALVKEAEKLYARSPDLVRRLIVSSAADGATAFADAFRLRKDEP